MGSRIWTFAALLLCLNGCSVNHSALTFKYNDAAQKLTRAPQSTIEVTKGKVLRLTLETARLGSLPEKHSEKKGEGGKREVMIIAKIFKNGQFVRYATITDIAEHMYPYQPAAINAPQFFTETIDGYYQICLKAYELDSKYAVRLLRQIRNTDLSVLDSTAYAPGDALTAGFQQVLYGAFDILASLTGKTVDGWIAYWGSTKVFEHSLYISPVQAGSAGTYLVIDSGNQKFFEDEQKTELDIHTKVMTNLTALESKTFVSTDLKSGKASDLDGSAYMLIKAEEL